MLELTLAEIEEGLKMAENGEIDLSVFDRFDVDDEMLEADADQLPLPDDWPIVEVQQSEDAVPLVPAAEEAREFVETEAAWTLPEPEEFVEISSSGDIEESWTLPEVDESKQACPPEEAEKLEEARPTEHLEDESPSRKFEDAPSTSEASPPPLPEYIKIWKQNAEFDSDVELYTKWMETLKIEEEEDEKVNLLENLEQSIDQIENDLIEASRIIFESKKTKIDSDLINNQCKKLQDIARQYILEICSIKVQQLKNRHNDRKLKKLEEENIWLEEKVFRCRKASLKRWTAQLESNENQQKNYCISLRLEELAKIHFCAQETRKRIKAILFEICRQNLQEFWKFFFHDYSFIFHFLSDFIQQNYPNFKIFDIKNAANSF